MTTKRKRYLSGYLPDGTVIRIRTAAEYSYLVVRRSPATSTRLESFSPYSRHFGADAAEKAARSWRLDSGANAVIVGLTEAKLYPSSGVLDDTRKLIRVERRGVVWTYPRCYACDAPGLKVSTEFNGNKRPACAGRHRDAEWSAE